MNDFSAELGDGVDVDFGDFCSHGDHGGFADLLDQFFIHEVAEVSVAGVEAGLHGEDDLGVGDVVGKNLGEFGEMPAVPLLGAHGVLVDFLVEVFEESDGLDDHHVDLFGRELELVAVQGVGKTEGGLVELFGGDVSEESVDVGLDSAGHVEDFFTVDARDAELFLDGAAEFGVENGEFIGDTLINVFLLEELLDGLGEFTVDELGGDDESISGALELVESLQGEFVVISANFEQGNTSGQFNKSINHFYYKGGNERKTSEI